MNALRTKHSDTIRAEISSLLATLQQGSGSATSKAISRLLQMREEIGLVSIIACYHHLPASARDEIAGYAESFRGVIAQLINCGDELARFNCIEFISRCDVVDFTALLCDATRDENPQVVEQAVSVIQTAARSFLSRRGVRDITDTIPSFEACRNAANAVQPSDDEFKELSFLLEALGSALEQLGKHRRCDIVDTLVRLGIRGDALLMQELRAALGRGKARLAMLDEMSSRPRNATMILLFSMLESGSAVLKRIAEGFLNKYSEGHTHQVLVNVLRSKGADATRLIIRRIRNIPWLDSCLPSLHTFRSEMVMGWLDAIDATRMDLNRKLQVVAKLINHPSELVIKRGFEVINTHYSPSVRPIMISLAESPREDVRFHALATLSKTRFQGRTELMKSHLRSDSGRIRDLAVRAMADDQFEKILRGFDKLDEKVRQTVAKMLDPQNPLHMSALFGLFKSPDPRIRLRALRILSYSGILPGTEPIVVELAKDEDRRVRSFASRMLSSVGSHSAIRRALELLDDADVRVKANAIECVEEFGHAKLQKALFPHLKSPANRVRANAAKAIYLLGSPLALRILDHMSKSTLPHVRMSSVWALANIKEKVTLKQAFDVAKFEPDRGLQRRMLRIIDDAEDRMRLLEYQESQKLLAVAA